MIYIQCKNDDGLETVDDCDNSKEAAKLLLEYRMSDKSSEYYFSSRACKAWRDAKKAVAQQE
jgi:YHS domain-containing protein